MRRKRRNSEESSNKLSTEVSIYKMLFLESKGLAYWDGGILCLTRMLKTLYNMV